MASDDRPEARAEVAQDVVRLIAPNPSPMTHWGTNTYVIGAGPVAVIDPGPDEPGHLAAILAEIGGREVAHILVTHAHRDHSPLARALSAETGAPVAGFGPPEAGRSETMVRLAAAGGLGGGEGVDAGFVPDRWLAHGTRLGLGAAEIEVLHTPGHFAGHLSFVFGDVLFSGDHLMGWASTLISPPDGDLAAFMASCTMLRARPEARYMPGHGAPVPDAHARLDWLVAHRQARTDAILAVLAAGAATAAALARAIYTDTPAALIPAAERNVFAHLIDLEERNAVVAHPGIAMDAVFELV